MPEPRKLTFLNKLFSVPSVYDAGAVIAPWVNEKRLPYPYRMTLVVTRKCNSRCQMCNIWRQKDLPELSLDDYRRIFSGNDMWFIRSLVLTGGEPTMRSDLPEVFKIAARGCRQLEHAYLATSALNTRRTIDYVDQMLDFSSSELPGLKIFQVQISVDGIGEQHDEIRGIQGFFEQLQRTLDGLRELQQRFPLLSLRLSTVVLPQNLGYIPDVRRFAEKENLPIHFSPIVVSGEYYENTPQADQLTTGDGQRQSVVHLFNDLAESDPSSMQFQYRDIAHMFHGAPRSRRCMMGFYELVLEHNAEVFACVNCESYSFGNLLETPFERLWFGAQATEARHSVRRNCCPGCPSPCHAPPINGWELFQLKLQGRLGRIKHRLKGRPPG